MALSCLLGRITTPQSILRAQSLKVVTSNFLKASTTANARLHHLISPEQNQDKSLTSTGQISALMRQFSSSPVRLSDQKGHDHVMIWKLERVLSIALVPLIPAAFIYPSQLLDTLCAVIIVMHQHWGLEAIVVDYIRPVLFGDLAPKIGLGLLYVFSIVVLAGLLNLIYNDAGLANAFIRLWKL